MLRELTIDEMNYISGGQDEVVTTGSRNTNTPIDPNSLPTGHHAGSDYGEQDDAQGDHGSVPAGTLERLDPPSSEPANQQPPAFEWGTGDIHCCSFGPLSFDWFTVRPDLEYQDERVLPYNRL